jgi:hypothetical protein
MRRIDFSSDVRIARRLFRMQVVQYVWHAGGLFPRKPPKSGAPAAVKLESAAELDRPSGAATLRRGGKANVQKRLVSASFEETIRRLRGLKRLRRRIAADLRPKRKDLSHGKFAQPLAENHD